MFCRDSSLVASSVSAGGAIPIKCRSWHCEWCQPDRQKNLVRQGISGNPVRFMTITRRREPNLTPDEAAQQIASAWRIIVRLARAEVVKPPHERWRLKHSTRTPEASRKLEYIISQDDQKFPPEVEYLCVYEKHKSGWPHLHLLVRSRYIDQAWLSEQTSRLLHSPVVGISWIQKGKSAAAYVAKYVGKDPHRFGTCKRYWNTKNYSKEQPTDATPDFPDCWQWERTNDKIEEIRSDWIRAGRQPYDVRGGGIAWGWWLPEVERHIAASRRGGSRRRFAPRLADTTKGLPARPCGP